MVGINFHVWAGFVFLLSTKFIISDCSHLKGDKENQVTCKNKATGFHMYNGDCTKYIWCLAMKGFAFRCPIGLTYNPFQKVCMFSHLPQCTTEPANTLYDRGKFRSLFIKNEECKRIVCMYAAEAQYRKEAARFLPKDIDAFLCTHVVYLYFRVVNYTLVIKDLQEAKIVKELMDKKKSKRNLRVIGAVGGNGNSDFFPNMVKSKSKMTTFIESSIKLLRKYDFDGLNLAWMYPGETKPKSHMDKYHFTTLLQEMRKAFDSEVVPLGKSRLLLSASVSGSKYRIDRSYEIRKIHKYLDFMLVRAYTYYGHWDDETGHNSPFNLVKKNMEYWSNIGTPNNKIVLGLPSFGRTFTLLNKTRTGLGAPARAGAPHEYTKHAGIISYFEICRLLWKRVDKKSILNYTDPYIVNGDQWIGYDDETSIWIKVQYMRAGLFGGVMISDMTYDDFRGDFCSNGKYPLLNTIKKACQDY